jgi:hypothetical protein
VTSSDRPPFTDEPGIRFGLATTAIVVLLLAAAAARVDDTATVDLAGAALLALGWALPRTMALCLAPVAWAFVTGFVVNGLGQLTFHDDDLRRLAVFALVGLIGALLPRGASLAEPRTRARSHLYLEDPVHPGSRRCDAGGLIRIEPERNGPIRFP